LRYIAVFHLTLGFEFPPDPTGSFPASFPKLHLPRFSASVSAIVSVAVAVSDSDGGSVFGQRITLICPVSVSVSPGQQDNMAAALCILAVATSVSGFFVRHPPPAARHFLLDKYLSISY